MALRLNTLDSRLGALDEQLGSVRAPLGADSAAARAIDRFPLDTAAARFHVRSAAGRSQHPPLLVILGGTGTGKSTLVNRLLERDVTATSFRRTFTAGAVAVAKAAAAVPTRWLGLEAVSIAPEQLPARGQIDALVVVPLDRPLTRRATLVDTPDLDGDQPAHHAQADRAFRWAQAVLFLVTPEKYQMTELLPYYRLAKRYALPAVYVMNKCEEQAVVEDYRQLLTREDVGRDARVFA